MLKKVLLASLLAAAPLAQAGDIDNLQSLAQSEFKELAKDLGAALSYKALVPAEPLGITGFDLGLEVTATKIENSSVLDKAMNGDGPTYLTIPKVHVHKGLPLNFDVGASLAAVPGSNIRLFGAEARWAAIEGGTATPAVALRLAYSKLTGVDQLDFNSTSADVSISKGLLNFTPYAGVGYVWSKSTPNGVAGLSAETANMSKLFGGVNVNFGLVNLLAEVDKTGKDVTYGAKLGFRF